MPKRFHDLILRAPEDAGSGGGAPIPPAGGAAPAGGAPAPQGAPGAGQAPGGETPSPSPAWRPQGLPDHFLKATAEETLAETFKAYHGARQALAERGEAPKTAGDYKFEPSDKAKPYANGIDAHDFWNKNVKESFHKHGLTSKQANGVLNDFIENLAGNGLLPPPFDADAEIARLAPGVMDKAQAGQAAQAKIQGAIDLLKTWREQGLPQDAHDWMSAQMDRAAMVEFVHFAAGKRSAETRPATSPAPSAAQVTEADLDARMKDPRQRASSPQFDARFAAETDAMFRKFYGEQPRG